MRHSGIRKKPAKIKQVHKCIAKSLDKEELLPLQKKISGMIVEPVKNTLKAVANKVHRRRQVRVGKPTYYNLNPIVG